MLPLLNFNYPGRQGLVYDFTVNGLKVQEKIGHIHKGKICFKIHKNNGTLNGVRKFQQYVEGDNNFYWLNSPDKDSFWVLPEHVLIEHGHVSNVSFEKPKSLYPHTCKWLESYIYIYKDVDMKKLTLLLGVS